MAARNIEFILTIVIVAAVITSTSAQASCSTVIISLSPCLDYVTGNSSIPSSGCCTQFATVVRSQPQCLCQVINGGSSSLGINLNQTQALALPSACKVETPPISRCIAASPTYTPSGTSGYLQLL
ncbi:non-specific lipid transfer protein GPI-anchored 5-like [Apium graveolens]|uniref:non-specific lipid transfer protein GPI-anchored 5-like n=1 Tax=Apium graveolens TaxID=4045 RepID=UPI003D78EB5A